MTNNINLTPLEKALATFKEVMKHPEVETNVFIKDSMVKRFEYTYELSWKLLKRFLEYENDLKILGSTDAFRHGGKTGILNNVENWLKYKLLHQDCAHRYQEFVHDEIYKHANIFISDVEDLLKNLKDAITYDN